MYIRDMLHTTVVAYLTLVWILFLHVVVFDMGHVLGNHEFKNVGYADWYKDWTHSETLP
jgi:hypothetical protein